MLYSWHLIEVPTLVGPHRIGTGYTAQLHLADCECPRDPFAPHGEIEADDPLTVHQDAWPAMEAAGATNSDAAPCILATLPNYTPVYAAPLADRFTGVPLSSREKAALFRLALTPEGRRLVDLLDRLRHHKERPNADVPPAPPGHTTITVTFDVTEEYQRTITVAVPVPNHLADADADLIREHLEYHSPEWWETTEHYRALERCDIDNVRLGDKP